IRKNAEPHHTDRNFLTDGQWKSRRLSLRARDYYRLAVNKRQPDHNTLESTHKADLVDNAVGQRLIFLCQVFSFSQENIFRAYDQLRRLTVRQAHIVLKIDRYILALEATMVDEAREDIRGT